MEMDPYLLLNREDRELAVGARVKVFWTAFGRRFSGRGKIRRLDPVAVEVELNEPIPAGREHPRIRRATVPRIVDSAEWSPSRCVRLERTR
ncbi:MAG TPA: hypothetical protein VKA48_01785 [Gammaproteobacteria bacterium]|nr:hypothetical protein [Gammaproteobacteria bacterium]